MEKKFHLKIYLLARGGRLSPMSKRYVKNEYKRLKFFQIFGGISFDLRGLKALNVTLKRTDLLLDLVDFLEFKEWQRMRDRRDGGEKYLILGNA